MKVKTIGNTTRAIIRMYVSSILYYMEFIHDLPTYKDDEVSLVDHFSHLQVLLPNRNNLSLEFLQIFKEQAFLFLLSGDFFLQVFYGVRRILFFSVEQVAGFFLQLPVFFDQVVKNLGGLLILRGTLPQQVKIKSLFLCPEH